MTEIEPSAPQRQAADGAGSVWVAASAGTGKTTVLTTRVLNLLLAGTEPGRILCLTFTKAAAAEMANWLNRRLAAWATMPEMTLRGEIMKVTGKSPTPEQYALATQLFARVLDTPGGMRILTLHAFCQSVLRRFPLEAGIPPQFEVMDERSTAELLEDVQNLLLSHARASPGSALTAALAEVLSHTREQGFAGLMAALVSERSRLAQLLADAGGLEPYLLQLSERLGVTPNEDRVRALADFSTGSSVDGERLRQAADVLSRSSKTDCDRGTGLAAWLALPGDRRAAGWDRYRDLFLTRELEPRARLATKAAQAAGPWVEASLRAEQDRVLALQRRLAALIVRDASAALARLGHEFLTRYQEAKRRRAVLDYDDLVLATSALLQRPGVAPWVLFKLDGGIDHILIDEAQDTNPTQWQVVQSLAEDFFTGQGAVDRPRTIFAVGDVKQSIFSFQRADPQEFLRMRRHFTEAVEAAQQSLPTVPLELSFRSTEPVLEVIDAVFRRGQQARDGVALDDLEIRHTAARKEQPGRVELWPVIEPQPAAEPENWALPVEQPPELAPRPRLAQMIARLVASWLASGAMLEAHGRPIRAGDVLVLVRRRGPFVTELLRELKQRSVPVAGADRMVLTRQLAVMDLMALGRFLLLPEDDLTLAAVLKSPLIGLDEERLYTLAQPRAGSLWQALRQHSAPWAVAAREMLQALRARADFVPPHELYAELLGAGGGRKRLLARLGAEAEDAIDEFLNQSLAYEQAAVPSLEGFLHWLDRGEAEVKRDLDADSARDQLRIMTVHGAKGLEAPIVFLPDTVAMPTQLPALLWPQDGSALLWAPGEGADDALAAAARLCAQQKRDQEYRRLLYVALTRAADRLYICGWNTKTKRSDACWYSLIETGMAGLGRSETIELPESCPGLTGPGLVHAAEPIRAAANPAPGTTEPAPSAPLPAWAGAPAPPEPAPPRPLVASRPGQPDPPVLSPLGRDLDRRRFQRGTLIHRLLQTLPDVPDSEAAAAARRFLAAPAHALDPEEQSQIVDETLAVLRHPDFAPLFGPQSRAEVPVVGLIDGKALSGRIDRLVVTAAEVMIIDYKTNRPPPLDPGDVAPAYLEQLAAYRAALERIYPDKRVRTLLLWTDGPRVMEIGR